MPYGGLIRPRLFVFDKPNVTTGPQVFAGRWRKPAGDWVYAWITVIGGGGSGGTGREGASSTTRNGGGGGGSAGLSSYLVDARTLPTELEITVGEGGASIAGRSTQGDGTTGNTGGTSIVAGWDESGSRRLVQATGGGPGTLGQASTAGNGGSGGSGSEFVGLTGGTGLAGGGTAPAATTGRACTAGGGGGGIDSSNNVSAGGDGGTQTNHAIGLRSLGGAANSAGLEVFRDFPIGLNVGGLGGGGSGGASTGTGANAADGIYGGGGGGGGGALNGILSGSSGRGGDGLIVIALW